MSWWGQGREPRPARQRRFSGAARLCRGHRRILRAHRAHQGRHLRSARKISYDDADALDTSSGAYADGQFYMLQARPVTGVEFSWDADVTESVQGNSEAVPYDNIWSRVFPEEMWTGAITPLMFSWRCWA